ncbi:MAG: flavin reductase family protein [Acidobacteria bacterium]|nr:flavin reductase family protein [Acidobacteriota bacterium]
MPVTKELFRHVLGHFATGVAVVTTRQPSGKPWGFTVNSFTSVSLEPPLVLYCVDSSGESARAIAGSDYFGVNFLGDAQEHISRRFASRSGDRFEGVVYTETSNGSPVLEGCLGYIECKKVALHTHGDHDVIIGEVLEAHAGEGNPLLFFRGAYGRLKPPHSNGH